MAERRSSRDLYVGVDVGGTKVLAALADAFGTVHARHKQPTPREGKPADTVAAIAEAAGQAIAAAPDRRRVRAVGLAIPGVVDRDEGRIVVTPNMNLSGLQIVPELEEACGVRVALGNDVNLGTLGEKWLGAARTADSAVGIFVGTGIGGGIIIDGVLCTGSRGAAGEIGHMKMRQDSPKCGCGGRGCLEALASRTAIERSIRKAAEAGRRTVLTELLDGDLSVIKSSLLRRALAEGDEVVTEVMRQAAEVLGEACVNIRHILDPEVIVLGGGVIEACESFVMPIVEEIVAADPLQAAGDGGGVVAAALGDDAVVLGAVALAQQAAGRDPMQVHEEAIPGYPEISDVRFGEITIAGKTYTKDVLLRADATVKKRKKSVARDRYGSSHVIGPEELERVCRGAPSVVIIGTGMSAAASLTDDAKEYLQRRAIRFQALPTPEAAEAYNKAKGRKAALMHLTC